MADGSGGGDGGGDGGGCLEPELYVLRDRVPVRCPHLDCWALWHAEPGNRHVAETHIGRARVSTIFLGIAHGFIGTFDPREVRMTSPLLPILFETRTTVEGEPLRGAATLPNGHEHFFFVKCRTSRCCTWNEAESMHAGAVSVVHRLTFPERYENQTVAERIARIAEEHRKGSHDG